MFNVYISLMNLFIMIPTCLLLLKYSQVRLAFKLIVVLKTDRHRYPDRSVLGHGHLRKVPQGGAALRCLTNDHLITKQIQKLLVPATTS
jgi:hypothetical protein